MNSLIVIYWVILTLTEMMIRTLESLLMFMSCFYLKTLLVNHLNINKLSLCLSQKLNTWWKLRLLKKLFDYAVFSVKLISVSWILSLLRLTIEKQLSCLKTLSFTSVWSTLIFNITSFMRSLNNILLILNIFLQLIKSLTVLISLYSLSNFAVFLFNWINLLSSWLKE